MAEKSESTRRGGLIAYAAVTVAVIAGLVFAASQVPGSGESAMASPGDTAIPTDAATPQEDDVNKPTPLSAKLLPEAKSGQDAIDSLGDSIAVAAKRNGMTVDELTELLLRDQTARVSTSGFILYVDTIQKRD